MASRSVTGLVLSSISLLLGACAIVDNFAPRVYSANVGSHFAANQEALLNIARASRYQSLNFVAISQTAGEQNENLKIGLPTLTFEPAQTPAQHQFVFASNSLESSVKGSFQSNPLTTGSFREGMLSPISSRTLALLLASFPREVLFHLLLDGFRVTSGNNRFLSQ